MEKIRLICTYKCNRKCVGCCNTQDSYIEDNVPAISKNELINTLSRYDELIITGGEPLLFKTKLAEFVMGIPCDIYIYTALIDHVFFTYISSYVDGITISIHEINDVDEFNLFHKRLTVKGYYFNFASKTNRLNIFPGMKELIDPSAFEYWKIKEIEMLDDCPLPDGEILYKLDKLW